MPRKYDETIPEELEDICVKALLKRPADRYQSCEAFAEDLWEYVDRKTGVLPAIPYDQQPVTITKGRLSFDQELFTEVDPKGNVLRKYPLTSIENVEVTPGINSAGPLMTGIAIIGAIAAFMLISSPVWSWTVTIVLLFTAFLFGLGWRMYNLKLVLTHGDDSMQMHLPRNWWIALRILCAIKLKWQNHRSRIPEIMRTINSRHRNPCFRGVSGLV